MPSYCNSPFYMFEILPDGVVQCCCGDWLPTPIGNIFESSAAEIWNGEIAQAIRRSILDETYKYCTRCPFLPRPQTDAKRPAAIMDKIPSLKLCYDRTCNLACPSCRPSIAKVDTEQVKRVHAAMLRSGVLDMALQVHASGCGDPFASPTYFNFFKELYFIAPHLEIALFTNGQLMDERHLDALGPSIDQIGEVSISVDAATEETYRLNRGGSWSKLWRNVELMNRRMRQPNRRLFFMMCYVVQANNFRELIPFTKLAFENQVDEVFVWYLRDWSAYGSKAEYFARAVHLPGHPDYEEFGEVMRDERLTTDKRIHLPTFPARELPLTP
jgi:MoaA/NifB/PqqE/SkfB family radical SAM enzyme